jgi:Short C-terminal domain
MARGQSHGLGFGNGSIIEYGGGGIEYRQTGKVLPAFKVDIADVTGFSVRKATRQGSKNGASALQQVLVLQGSGTELATCPVNYGTAQKIEALIRKHPSFRGNVPQNAPIGRPQGTAQVNIADELTKLAQLRDTGVLSPEEFDQAKAKLLS